MTVRLPERVSINFDGFEDEVKPDHILCNDIVFPGEYNPHNVGLWRISIVVSNTGGPHTYVWASHEQDALDIAADEELIECARLEEQDQDDYIDHDDKCPEGCKDPGGMECMGYTENFARLGNAGDPFVLDNVSLERVDLTKQGLKFMMLLAEARGANVKFLSDLQTSWRQSAIL